MMAEIEILSAGHCGNFARLARHSAPWRWVTFPASFGLIRPGNGAPMLFDTGYSRHVLPAMARFPFWLYRRALPITLGLDAAELLRRRDIDPASVGTIVVSHFHPDHIGGLRDFPNARFVCSRRAWDWVRGRTGFAALRRGFLADLVPPDFTDRVTFYEDLPPVAGGRLLHEQFTLLPLEGHVPGQLGLLAGNTLFAADALWRRASLDDGIGPHPLAMRVHHDRRAYGATMEMLARMKRENPALNIVPCHDAGEGPC